MADLSSADQQQINQLIATDPQLQQILAQARVLYKKAPTNAAKGQAIAQLDQQMVTALSQRGVSIPQGYGFDVNGQVGKDTWFEKNAPWLIPAALGGTAAITALTAPAIGATAPATGGSTMGLGPTVAGAGGDVVPMGVPPSISAAGGFGVDAGAGGLAGDVTGLGPVAAGGGTTAATVPTALSNAGIPAATTASSTGFGAALKNVLGGPGVIPAIIGAGAGLGGAAIAASAAKDAAKIQAAEADKALAIQQQQYALQRQDTAPYRALGQGAVNSLGYLGGIDTTSNLPALASTVPTQTPPPLPTASTPPAYNSPQTSGTSLSPLVKVQNPATGLVHLIPSSQVPAAQQAGGVVV